MNFEQMTISGNSYPLASYTTLALLYPITCIVFFGIKKY
jgi:hypothetical protein